MDKDKASKIWNNKWESSIHTTEYAKKRIKSAKSAKLTPIIIDAQDFYGYFQGGSGKYETFLDFCPCGDFRRSKLPCKHIYRLAIELGLMDEDAENNINAVITPKDERATLDETIDIIECLSENAQLDLCQIAANIRSTTPTYCIEPNNNISELIQSGIVVNAHPDKYKITFGKKIDIVELLESEGIAYDKKSKKSVLQEICTELIPQKAAERFGKKIYVSIPTKFSPMKIHHYLHRKFGCEFCVDDSMNEYELPLLSTSLPDDDVTNQLIKHGYYSRKKQI